MGSRSGIVSQPDTEVLDLEGVDLLDLDAGDDLSGGPLELTQLTQEVPKPKQDTILKMYFVIMVTEVGKK